MGNTLAEVDTALQAVEGFLPLVLGGLNIFAPGAAAAVTPFLPLFQAAVAAVDTVSKDKGQPWDAVLQDSIKTVVDHLTPGAAAAAPLSPSAPPTGQAPDPIVPVPGVQTGIGGAPVFNTSGN